MKGKLIMKNKKTVFIVTVLALGFALAPILQAGPRPDGGPNPVNAVANHQSSPRGGPPPASGADQLSPVRLPPPPTGPEDVELPAINIHRAGNILRGKTGTFILEMKPALMFGGMYANFSVSGSAVAGVDYVPFLSPAYIGQSGYAVISFATLPNPRAGSARQAYSVVVKLEPGLGYAIGESNSATIWIKSAQ